MELTLLLTIFFLAELARLWWMMDGVYSKFVGLVLTFLMILNFFYGVADKVPDDSFHQNVLLPFL